MTTDGRTDCCLH